MYIIIYFILVFSRTWWIAIRVKGCPCTKPEQNCSRSLSLSLIISFLSCAHSLCTTNTYTYIHRRDRTMPIYGRQCPTECGDVTVVSRAKVSTLVLIIPAG